MQFVLVVGLLCLKCVRWFFSPWSWGVIFCLNVFFKWGGHTTSWCFFVSFFSLWLFLKISSELMINKSSIGFSSLKMVIAQVLTPVIFFRQFSRLIVYLNQKWSQRSRCLHRVVLGKKRTNYQCANSHGLFWTTNVCGKVLIDFYWFLARINSLKPGDIVLKLFGSRPLDLGPMGSRGTQWMPLGISNIQKLPKTPPPPKKKMSKINVLNLWVEWRTALEIFEF